MKILMKMMATTPNSINQDLRSDLGWHLALEKPPTSSQSPEPGPSFLTFTSRKGARFRLLIRGSSFQAFAVDVGLWLMWAKEYLAATSRRRWALRPGGMRLGSFV